MKWLVMIPYDRTITDLSFLSAELLSTYHADWKPDGRYPVAWCWKTILINLFIRKERIIMFFQLRWIVIFSVISIMVIIPASLMADRREGNFDKKPVQGISGIDFISEENTPDTLVVYPESENRLTIDQALAQAQPGTIIVLAPGNYYPPDRLQPAVSGLAGNPVIIKAAQVDTAVIHADGNKYGFYLYDKSHIIIDGLIIRGFYSGCGVKVLLSHHITLKNLTVSDSQSHTISVADSHSSIIENCTTSGSRSIGICVAPTNLTPADIHDNIITGNESLENDNSGILIYGDNNLITENFSHHNGTRDPYDHGIYCIGNTNTVTGNTCHDNAFGSGIRLGDRDHIVRNNRCYGNGQSGIIIGGTNDSHDILIEGNELEDNGHSGVQINASDYLPSGIMITGNMMQRNTYHIYIQNGVTGVSITDNIFSDPITWQMEIRMSLNVAVSEISLDQNSFYGPNCMFYVAGQAVPSNIFLGIGQPGATCSGSSY